MIWSKFTKKRDFLHFNEIWLMFRPIPMYETNAIQLYFLVRLFWYLSQWSGSICSIFCTRLYSKDIHCDTLKECFFINNSTFLGRRRIGSLRFQLSDGLNKAEKGKTYTFNVRVKDLSIHLERHERYLFTLTKVEMAKKWNQMGFFFKIWILLDMFISSLLAKLKVS